MTTERQSKPFQVLTQANWFSKSPVSEQERKALSCHATQLGHCALPSDLCKLVKKTIRLSSLFVQIVSGAHPSTLAIHHHRCSSQAGGDSPWAEPTLCIQQAASVTGGLATCEYFLSIYQVHNGCANSDETLSRQEAMKGPR